MPSLKDLRLKQRLRFSESFNVLTTEGCCPMQIHRDKVAFKEIMVMTSNLCLLLLFLLITSTKAYPSKAEDLITPP